MKLTNISSELLEFSVPTSATVTEIRSIGPYSSMDLAPGTNIMVSKHRLRDLQIEGREGETIGVTHGGA